MADADRLLVPLSRRAFDLNAMSLPFGPNYGDAEFVTAFKGERCDAGSRVGAGLPGIADLAASASSCA